MEIPMKQLYFYDWDPYTDEEFDLCGVAYKALIDFCFLYSKTVSFMDFYSNTIPSWLKKYEIDQPKEITVSYFDLGIGKKDQSELNLHFYRACPEIHKWMLESANGIFEWLNGRGFHNPENPIFYREDGSIVFCSVIHDGELFVQYRKDEDVLSMISSAPWRSEKIITSYPPNPLE